MCLRSICVLFLNGKCIPMPYIRRYRLRKPLYRRRRAAGARRIPLYRPAGRMYRAGLKPTTFTETYRYGTISNPAGGTGSVQGIWKVRMLDLPQLSEYAALYNQYCIKRVQLTIVPSYNVFDSNNAPTATPSAITAPRLVYAINDSAQQPVPASESDVLTDNGCKIVMLTRPVKISFRPVAEVAMGISTGGFVSESKRTRWLSFVNPEVLHAGVSFAITQFVNSTVDNDPMATIYAKITFGLRDPK